MSSIPMRWRDWFNTARLCYELRELRQGWAQYERIHDALIGRYETKIAALESENVRLKEALRECVAALEQCACPDCQPDSDLCVARGYPSCHVINAITKAREVLGDD